MYYIDDIDNIEYISDSFVQSRNFHGKDVKIHPGELIFKKWYFIVLSSTISFLDWKRSQDWFFPQDIALLTLDSFEIGIYSRVNPICLPIYPNHKFDRFDIKSIGE